MRKPRLEYYKQYREAHQAKRREYKFKAKYGITHEEYDRLNSAQGGLCAICEKPPTGYRTRLSVDHLHGTGDVRALLCANCNIGLGCFGDDPDRILRAAQYVDNHSERSTGR